MIIFSSALFNVTVNLMMPLNTLFLNGSVNWQALGDNAPSLNESFAELVKANVTGIMMDVWWGIAEPQPNEYNFDGYYKVIAAAVSYGLQVQPVMSFHQCGGNQGDNYNVSIPEWALNVSIEKGFLYQDQWGLQDQEYLSAGADDNQSFPTNVSGTFRTPIDIYFQFMQAFHEVMMPFFNGSITQIQVGLGPCGELRYPAYHGPWKFPGIGAFQAFDKNMLRQFALAAANNNYPHIKQSPPTNVGNYNSLPENTSFFGTADNNSAWEHWNTPWGQFFLNWYQEILQTHASSVLLQARKVFPVIPLAAKVAGIYWWYGTPTHAAECTTGYNNANGEAYFQLALTFGEQKAILDFTCMDLTDQEYEQNYSYAKCEPQELTDQVFMNTTRVVGIIQGENSQPVTDNATYDVIYNNIVMANGAFMEYTHLRLTAEILQKGNWAAFSEFVQKVRQVPFDGDEE